MATDLVFYLFAILAVVSGFFVVFSRNIVHAGFSLLFTLFGVAGLYGLLGADFVAVTQVLVYIGGVLVLVLFAVMMTQMPRRSGRRGLDRFVPASVFALAIFAVLYRLITSTTWSTAGVTAPRSTIAEIGVNFMTDYILPFEYVSLALLVAMIGAAILIRERRPQPPEPAQKVADAASPEGDGDPGATDAAGDGSDREEVHA